jgi:HlyD family secretion protein
MLQAELDLGRISDLAERGFVTPADLDQARTRLEAAKASYESSVHQIERQEMQLKEARDQLGKASLFAPMSGTIISINAELGDRVVGTGQFAGTTIMRIADLGNMELRVAVSEIDIVTVAINNQAEIEVDALPGETFMGTVYEIANSALTSGSGSQEQQTTFEVRIRFDTPDPRLRPGMTATADIRTRTVTDVIKVPLGSVVVRPRREVQAAINGDTEEDTATAAANEDEEVRPERGRRGRDDRARVVFVVEDGKAMLRQVETGISDRDHIEILSGLEGSERLITGPYRAITRELKHGDAVVERSREDNGGKR